MRFSASEYRADVSVRLKQLVAVEIAMKEDPAAESERMRRTLEQLDEALSSFAARTEFSEAEFARRAEEKREKERRAAEEKLQREQREAEEKREKEQREASATRLLNLLSYVFFISRPFRVWFNLQIRFAASGSFSSSRGAATPMTNGIFTLRVFSFMIRISGRALFYRPS